MLMWQKNTIKSILLQRQTMRWVYRSHLVEQPYQTPSLSTLHEPQLSLLIEAAINTSHQIGQNKKLTFIKKYHMFLLMD